MLLIGNMGNFDDVIKNNIQLGLRENKIVPCFVYEGEYTLQKGIAKVRETGQLSEIIEEVCYLDNGQGKINQQILITRETGQSRGNRLPNSRISLVESNENSLNVWRPLLSEIFEGLKSGYEMGSKYFLTVVKEISENLGSNKDFKVIDLINKNYSKAVQEFTPRFHIQINQEFTVNEEAFFLLIKHIMMTEDITYNRDGQMGRYLMQLAIYDYVVRNIKLESVLEKYGLSN
ncbi:TPA: hypothetical protein ROX87_004807 [Bacillus thuringiensis]|uniref:hypothetical protein n=1 Tax=Bacillus thuringiensis TaxID=1428 RepID=UPI000BF2A896|nr:hypothetical protein [Bacillus thuringiensis]PER40858.1 hypothetical protein CN472_28900 [Bacillus thuringiensis]HDX9535337.1 hypothetical protein [Bacillus thuringiensis]